MARWAFSDRQEGEDGRVAIARFWKQFREDLPRIEGSIRGAGWDVAAWMSRHLPSAKELEWEFGPTPTGHLLAISAAWRRQLAPLAEAIVSAAPALDGWQFVAERPPAEGERARQAFCGRSRSAVDLEGFRFEAKRGEHNTIEVTCWWPERRKAKPAEAAVLSNIATSVLIGERLFYRWVSRADPAPRQVEGLLARFFKETPPSGWHSAAELRARVQSIADEIERSLPEKTLDRWERSPADPDGFLGQEYTLEPRQRDDYPARSDLVVAMVAKDFTPHFEAAHLGDKPFRSSRFSRHAEIFCYLKIDGRNGWGFEDRGVAEEALDNALREHQVGRVLFGGTGLWYSYIDLALSDVPRALDVMRPILQSGRADVRTWLLFYDHEYADEWLGIWPEAPAPPTHVA